MAWHPFRNAGLKMGALALGTLLWFVVSGRQIERRLAVPLTYSNVMAPLELTGEQVDTVSVHVRGGENVVSALREGDLRVVVDLGGTHAGANIIPLRTDEVVAPLGVEVLQIDPGTVTVNLERSGQMDALVRPTVEGRPAPGYVVGPVTVEPRMVTIAGPEGRLRESATVVTERVMLEGRTDRIVQDVGVGVADAQLRVVRPHTVRVTVEIFPAKGVR
jgi:YbbR domain-containing protein